MSCLYCLSPPSSPHCPAVHCCRRPLLSPHADVFLGLDAAYQQVIADICRKMGAGMADFAESGAPGAAAASPSKAKGRGRAKPKAAAARDGEAGEEAVESIADYNLYCHYVAGLVGIGLSQLFASSGEIRWQCGCCERSKTPFLPGSQLCICTCVPIITSHMCMHCRPGIAGIPAVRGAGKRDGPVPAEDQHHPRLPGAALCGVCGWRLGCCTTAG